MREEPSYMMFARANVKDNLPSSPVIVRELLDRIARLEAKDHVVIQFNYDDVAVDNIYGPFTKAEADAIVAPRDAEVFMTYPILEALR